MPLNPKVPQWDRDYSAKKALPFKKGDFYDYGNLNEYDVLAQERKIYPLPVSSKNWICPILSEKKRTTVIFIKTLWRPKKAFRGKTICSWYSNGDYSKDERFEQYQLVNVQREDLCYELAWFLKGEQ